MAASPSPEGETLLDRIVVVLYQPQDLVNIALVIRAMKNMGLSRLRLVKPAEWDEERIDGIAHDTRELVARAEIVDEIEAALAGCVRVVATTARRRAVEQEWYDARGGASHMIEWATRGDVALVFGREDRGLPNRALDRCDDAVSVPTSPDHPSLNLGHAAVLLFYELRLAADEAAGVAERDLSGKARDEAPPATADEMERFFGVWRRAMHEIGMFRNVSPVPKMRSYRRIFRRAAPDRRELRLLESCAWRVIHYAERTRLRLEGGRRRPPDETGVDDAETDEAEAQGEI